jgi:hypothetical protein
VTVTPLPRPSAHGFRDLLQTHGWEAERAREAAAGMEAAAFHCHSLDPATLESLVLVAGRLGLEVITGDDWALVAGAHSRLTALARPWTLPPELVDFAMALGGALHQVTPLDPP